MGRFLHIVFLFLLFFSEPTFQQLETLNSPSEHEALMELRSSLGLRTKDWPIKSDPCLIWNGIDCRNGRVIGINISGFKRTRLGRKHPQFSVNALSNLTLLESFIASHFSLPGLIPNWFGPKLSSLQILDLRSCSIDGPIPSSLGKLTNLTDLYLSDNHLTGKIPASFSQLVRLLNLDLSSNHLSGSIPPSIGSLSKLQYLNFSINNLTSSIPSQFTNLHSLVNLDLSFNSLFSFNPRDFIRFNNFSSLRLNISHNMLYGDVMLEFRRFRFVDLSWNYLEGKIPDYMVRNSSLLNNNCLQNVSNQRGLIECSSFYSQRGLKFDEFGISNSTEEITALSSFGKMSRKVKILMASVFGGLGLLILVSLFLVLLVLLSWHKNSTNQRASVGPADDIPGISINFLNLGNAFTYQELLHATNGFSDANLIKQGHSGDLFRGMLEGGTQVVIKKVDSRLVKEEAYLLELDFFSKYRHDRFVPLLGHSLENRDEKLIVYKYMVNGDLWSSLIRKSNVGERNLQSLDWITRSKIALGAAEGLTFLHECALPLVHRDVQASSILLDDKFEVRLGSFSDVSAQGGDSHQNRLSRFLCFAQSSSKQFSSGSVTAVCSYDVYCFGKVLLELVTGKLRISSSNDNDTHVKEWLEQTLACISIYDKELVTKIMDPTLHIDEDFLEEVWAMAVVAKSCLNPKPSRRPVMRYVLKALENPLQLVREEKCSGRVGMWNAALFGGSWSGVSLSDMAVGPVGPVEKFGGGSGDGGLLKRRHSRETVAEFDVNVEGT